MNKKALYYRVIVREVDRMVNDGFIIANICDALGQYEKQWKIPIQNECFELPLYIETHLLSEEDYENMDKDEEEEYEVIKIETLEQISQNSQKEKYNKILQKFKKNNNVFN